MSILSVLPLLQRGYAKGKTNPSRVAHECDPTIEETIVEGEGRRRRHFLMLSRNCFIDTNAMHLAC